MKKKLLKALAAGILCTSLHADIQPMETFELKLEKSKECDISFVSHEETWKHFLEGKAMLRARNMTLLQDVLELSERFPTDPRVQVFVEHFITASIYGDIPGIEPCIA